MLRRFELYTLAPTASPGPVGDFERACRTCGRYISEVLDSATGRNQSPAPVQLVWEHAFDAPEAYRRYMVHPFHAAVLDRYLLPDSPERLVTHNALGAGLVGYECDGPAYRMGSGVRRLVLLRLDHDVPPDGAARLTVSLTSADAGIPGLVVSVVAANTLGAAWFDGVTPVGPPPRWTHLWEQAFDGADTFASYRARSTWRAGADPAAWNTGTGGLVSDVAEVWYPIAPEPGRGVPSRT